MSRLNVEIERSMSEALNKYLSYGERKKVFLPIIQNLLDLFKNNEKEVKLIIAAIESGYIRLEVTSDPIQSATKNVIKSIISGGSGGCDLSTP